jgi:hypothetical protein
MRVALLLLTLLLYCGVSYGQEERWVSFAEDSDLRYYLDQKSIRSLPDNVYLFWLKSVAKNKDYFRTQYNLSDLAYIYTSYELDCAVSAYRVRGTIMFDKQRREISKEFAAPGDTAFEPVPPESLMELVQSDICVKGVHAADNAPSEEQKGTPAAATAETGEQSVAPETPEPPLAPAAPARPLSPSEPRSPQPPSLQ